MEDFYETPGRRRSASASWPARRSSDGFTAFKSMAVPPTMPIEGLAPIRYAEACVAAMREAVGRRRSTSWSTATPGRRPRMGHLFAKALEPYGLYWFEEPCWPESIDDLAAIQRAVSTPIATGERLVGVQAFRELLDEARLQRDPAGHHALRRPDRGAPHRRAGRGVSRRARAAQSAGPGLAPRPRSSSASRRPPTSSARRCTSDVPWRDEVATESHPIDPNGMLARATDKPGLGIEIDLDDVAKHPFEPELLQRVFYADGSVGDW